MFPGGLHHRLHSLIDSCLNDDLHARATAVQVQAAMSKIVKMETSIVEEVLRHLADHASSMEQVVAERTNDLIAETNKVDDLLREMLPEYHTLVNADGPKYFSTFFLGQL